MHLSEAIHGFYLYQLSANYSPITAKGYNRLLSILARYLDNPVLNTITTEQITDFFAHLRQNGNSETTVHTYWRTIRSFYNWASSELSIERPDHIPSPRHAVAAITPFTVDEIKALLKHAKSKRHTALILVLLDTGLRVSECARLTVADCDLESGTVQVRAWHNGRKSRPRTVRLGNLARRAVWAYIANRTDPITPNAPLFVTDDGKPLERFGIAKILKRIAANAGVAQCNPHKFRHTFAIQYLRNGGDIFTLQELLGHASLSMVRHYLAISQMDIDTAHRRASPVDNWRL